MFQIFYVIIYKNFVNFILKIKRHIASMHPLEVSTNNAENNTKIGTEILISGLHIHKYSLTRLKNCTHKITKKLVSHLQQSWLKYLYPVILSISHHNSTIVGDHQTFRTPHLTFTSAPGAEHCQKAAIGVENLLKIYCNLVYK